MNLTFALTDLGSSFLSHKPEMTMGAAGVPVPGQPWPTAAQNY